MRSINNKVIGTDFEREFCKLLAGRGYWVHFISPAANGGQPFDVIAVKDGKAYAFDCKTSVSARFPITRLEENQIMAFERWITCGNNDPQIAVKYKLNIYLVSYKRLKEEKVVELDESILYLG